MIDTFLTNFKAVIQPEEFVNLGLDKRKLRFLYTVVIMLIIVLLCDIIPQTISNKDLTDEIQKMYDEGMPEFELTRGILTINDDKEGVISVSEADGYIYYNTSVESFSSNYADANYVLKFLTDEEAQKLSDGYYDLAIFMSRTNVVKIRNGMIEVTAIKDICTLFQLNNKTVDKAYVRNKLPEWIHIFMTVVYVFECISAIIGLYFFSLLWAMAAKLVDLIVGGGIPFGALYTMVIHIRIIALLVRHILNNVPLLTSKQWGFVCKVITLVYIILALVLKKKKNGRYRRNITDVKYMPGGYGMTDFNYQSNNFNDDMFSNKPFDPMPMNQQATSVRTNTGYNPNPAYSAGNTQQAQPVNLYYKPNTDASAIHTNTGYNPNPAYSASPQTGGYMNPIEDEDELEDSKFERTDLVQDSNYTGYTAVWDRSSQAGSKKLGNQAYTSQQWRPQAYSDFKAERQKWNESSQKWDPNQKKNFTQEWNPQRASQNSSAQGNNSWQNQQTWKGVADTSNPTMAKRDDKAGANEEQWNHTPVWGKK